MVYERCFYRKEQLLKAIDNVDSSISIAFQTYDHILQGCTRLNGLEEGRLVHLHVIKAGLEGNLSTGNKLINMYCKCGSVIDARGVFDKMTFRDVISWTSITGGYAQHGLGKEAFDIFFQMKGEGMVANRVTYLCILDAFDDSADLDKGKLVHFDAIVNGVALDIIIATALVNMYGKCGSIKDASNVFYHVDSRDVVLCTAMLSVFTQHGHAKEALKLFKHMDYEGVQPNEFTFTGVLCVCASLLDLVEGKSVHVRVLSLPTTKASGFVEAALVNMYAKCGCLQNAQSVFDKLEDRDVTSWTALITGYAQHGFSKEAFELLQQMQLECLEADVVVANALIDLYSKCGNLTDARRTFEKMSKRDTISWSTLITGYAQQGLSEDAFELFAQMLTCDLYPDHFTTTSILSACANLTALGEGMEVHAYVVDFGLDSDTFVRNALVSLYAKCGAMEDANSLLHFVFAPGLEAWNSMILGYGQHGYGKAAYNTFKEMLKEALKPDEFTYSGVLSACASLAMQAEGQDVHDHITRTGFEVNKVVGNALIDMYATCGSVEEACAVFHSMPDADLISWSAMIGGWAQHGYGKEALLLYHKMQKQWIVPDEFTYSSILIACSHSGLVEEGWYCLSSMEQGHGIMPTAEHYARMVDLLGRSGCLWEANEVVFRAPIQPHSAIWMCLLAVCRSHGNMELAEYVAGCAFDLGLRDAAVYVLLSNIYAMGG